LEVYESTGTHLSAALPPAMERNRKISTSEVLKQTHGDPPAFRNAYAAGTPRRTWAPRRHLSRIVFAPANHKIDKGRDLADDARR